MLISTLYMYIVHSHVSTSTRQLVWSLPSDPQILPSCHPRPGFQPGFFPGYCQGPAPAWVWRPGILLNLGLDGAMIGRMKIWRSAARCRLRFQETEGVAMLRLAWPKLGCVRSLPPERRSSQLVFGLLQSIGCWLLQNCQISKPWGRYS